MYIVEYCVRFSGMLAKSKARDVHTFKRDASQSNNTNTFGARQQSEAVHYSHSTTKSSSTVTSEEFHSLLFFFDIKSCFLLPSRSLNIMHMYKSIFLTMYELQEEKNEKNENNVN